MLHKEVKNNGNIVDFAEMTTLTEADAIDAENFILALS